MKPWRLRLAIWLLELRQVATRLQIRQCECGKIADIRVMISPEFTRWVIHCDDCGFQGKMQHSLDEAVQVWQQLPDTSDVLDAHILDIET